MNRIIVCVPNYIVLVLCAMISIHAGVFAQTLQLGRDTAIWVSPDAPVPVRRAAEDLASDLEKVLGDKPAILQSEEDAARAAIIIGEAASLPAGIKPAGLTAAESFSLSVVRARMGGKPHSVVRLAGADMRGTIYAIYEFSQEYLGVDPLYYWTDRQPARRDSVAVPANLNKVFPAPVFRYRGFFINDEDLLTGWAPGWKDHSGISLAVWDKIYETILRLKGNMVAPGTWIFPDDPQVKLAAERGLVLTQHHAIPLGLNVARWPADVPYNYSTHPEILERAWRNAVQEYPSNLEVLWTVGLRGLSDVTYASMDPSVRGNNQALGQLITRAIANQMKIVRAVHPEAKFITSLWQEGARLVQQGDLKIPPEVTTVWADDGYGYLQDNGDVKAGQGAYEHIAMMNGRANQLSEMVPVERSLSEIARYLRAGATQYYLVNTSDLRPVTMSARAVMDAVWKGVPKEPDAADVFYRQWAAEEFGEKAAPQIAEIYKEYFRAPAHFGSPVHEYGDQLYHTEVRRMLLTFMIDSPLYALPSQAPKWEPARMVGEGFGSPAAHTAGKEWLESAVAREIQQCGEAQARWDDVWKKAVAAESLVESLRLPFYQEQVLAMIAINRESNRILYLISKAIQDASAGQTEQAHREALAALKAFDDIEKAENEAEYGKWKDWYRGDWLTGIPRTRELVRTFVNFLNDPLTPLPPPVLWDGWEAYYHIMQYEKDRTVDVK
ncbi:MAG: glycosyl hydrolase 115 family protein [Acidobacterium ailaaui]|nr:glycosyl hydrolase 115 family protein [Pseudacidobacterium ailaaui]